MGAASGDGTPLGDLLGILVGGIGVVVASFVAARWLDRRKISDLGLHLNPSWWLDLSFGLGLGVLLMGLIFAAEFNMGWISIVDRFYSGGREPFSLAILWPLGAFLLVGIYEEILSRGYHLVNLAEGFSGSALGERGGLLLAWALSSAVFGALHAANPNASWISTLNIMLAGLFLGLGMLFTGELAVPIGLHISWNFAQGNLFGFPVSGTRFHEATFYQIEQHGPDIWTGGAFGPEAGLIGILAILLGSLLTLAWLRWRHGELRLALHLARYRSKVDTPQSDQTHFL